MPLFLNSNVFAYIDFFVSIHSFQVVYTLIDVLWLALFFCDKLWVKGIKFSDCKNEALYSYVLKSKSFCKPPLEITMKSLFILVII